MMLVFLGRELSGRLRHTLLSAVGLPVGVGLVITVTAAAAGVGEAQAAVLHSLNGVGTDATVTTAQPAPAGAGGIVNGSDLAKATDLLRVAVGLGVLDASSVAAVARLPHVAAAAGGLTLADTVFRPPAAGEQTGLGSATSFAVNGADVAHLGLGPFSSGRIASGRTFTARDASAAVAVVDSRYAAAHGLRVGSIVTVAGEPFTVIGVLDQPRGGGAADVYIPLARAQALATSGGADAVVGKVSTIYVAATSSADLAAVAAEIARLLPTATVTTSGDLASKASGSLADVATLSANLGRWLAVTALVTAFAASALLAVSAVSRRAREFGTLRALGWTPGRIVAQVLAESVVVGIAGAALGVAIGLGGAAVIGAIAPGLSAVVSQNPGSPPAKGVSIGDGVLHETTIAGSFHTVTVHLHAPVSAGLLGLAVALAITGALIAGSLAAWRTTRLSPSAALTRVV